MWLGNASLRKPTNPDVYAFVATMGLRRLSYDSVGMTVAPGTHSGYHRTDDSVPVASWDRAVAAVRRWAMHDQGWAEVLPRHATIETGRDVATTARAGGLWWLFPARVVAVVDEPGRWGFAYGTLEGHILVGEELFVVEQREEGAHFRIIALSRPADWLAALGVPAIRQFQRKFVQGALASVQDGSV